MSRALVLSGGGPVGIAWESGIAAGLSSAGIALSDADAIVGTSAGSAVGAQIGLRRDMQEVVDRYRRSPASPTSSPGRRAAGAFAGPRVQGLMETWAKAFETAASPEESRAIIGTFALEADTGPEDDFVAGFRYLAGETWPRCFACTAVDAATGEFVVWDADSGVDLARAVASSCAVPGVFPPITISGRRYIDGGMRSGTNADLVKGHDRVLVVSMLTSVRMPDTRTGQRWRRVEDEVATLRDAGAHVEVLSPDEEGAPVLGMNLMDSSRLAQAADQGRRQGEAEAARVREVWF